MNNEQAKFLKSFGQRLAAMRRQRGLSQEELADRVELHRTYIGYIEQGKRNPSIGNIRKIARVLGVRLRDLFGPY
jgi:transcriptional regulator with XRE-family HTH domain